MRWPWIFLIFLIVYLAAAVINRLKRRQSENPQEGAIPRKSPWWLYGFQFVFFCFYTYYSFFRTDNKIVDYDLLAMMGFCLVIMFFQFVREFIKQHAQYSIKSVMMLTVGVAMLCSIYSCFGLTVLLWTMLLLSLILSQWVRIRMEKSEPRNRK
jgi:hypothetical protein